MNLQEIFNKVASHLLKQNEKSKAIVPGLYHEPIFDCAYRGETGLMCAVGCLISDAAYHPNLEGKSADADEVVSALFASGIDSYDEVVISLLSNIQAIHDGDEPHEWKSSLNDLADSYQLEHIKD